MSRPHGAALSLHASLRPLRLPSSCAGAWVGSRLAAALTALTTLLFGAATACHSQTVIPSRFESDRVYVQLETVEHAPLELYTDTGGGGLVLSDLAAARLRLSVAPSPGDATQRVATAPKLRAGLPELPTEAAVIALATQVPGWPQQADGFLGAPWFAGAIWTWDYPAHILLKEERWEPTPGSCITPLSFKREPDGTRTTGFARMVVTIDGRRIPMLLDTGAETYLTAEAAVQLGGGDRMRATSMMAASVFDAWRHAHPDWPHVVGAQEVTRADMIEVPDVQVAGIQVGPVWFTRRPDFNFHTFMSSMTDAPVDGALGGNAFRDLRMTIDFPGARAAFRSVRGAGSRETKCE
jgi:hypothetical protein